VLSTAAKLLPLMGQVAQTWHSLIDDDVIEEDVSMRNGSPVPAATTTTNSVVAPAAANGSSKPLLSASGSIAAAAVSTSSNATVTSVEPSAQPVSISCRFVLWVLIVCKKVSRSATPPPASPISAHQKPSTPNSLVKLGTPATALLGPWEPDDLRVGCFLCQAPFQWNRRRHHCRICGKLCCSACSPHLLVVPELGADPVRACSTCNEYMGSNKTK
jgi:hypothetical protein